MARTSRVAHRSTGPFPVLLAQLAKTQAQARKRAASRPSSSRPPQTRQEAIPASSESPIESQSTTNDSGSDYEEEEVAPSPPRKRARVVAKRTSTAKSKQSPATAKKSRPAAVVEDGSIILRQNLEATKERLAKVEETLRNKERELAVARDRLAKVEETLQNKEREIAASQGRLAQVEENLRNKERAFAVSNDMLVTLDRENAKLRNIAKLYEKKINAERTERKKARRKQARIEWQLKKYATDDHNIKTVNGILNAEFQEDEMDEALRILRDYIADAKMTMSNEDYRGFREAEESVRMRNEGKAYVFQGTETDDEYGYSGSTPASDS